MAAAMRKQEAQRDPAQSNLSAKDINVLTPSVVENFPPGAQIPYNNAIDALKVVHTIADADGQGAVTATAFGQENGQRWQATTARGCCVHFAGLNQIA